VRPAALLHLTAVMESRAAGPLSEGDAGVRSSGAKEHGGGFVDTAAQEKRAALATVRSALWLSLVCAATAAVVAVPAGALEFLVNDAAWKTFGNGVDFSSCFNDPGPMLRREPYTCRVDRSSAGRRGTYLLGGGLQQMIVLGLFPLSYALYLGSSRRAYALMSLPVVLTFLVIVVGFVFSGYFVFFNYSAVFGCFFLCIVLWRLCPHGSRVPMQAVKQSVLLLLWNVLVMNVIPERTVRRRLACLPGANRQHSQRHLPSCAGPRSFPASFRVAQLVQGDWQRCHGVDGVLSHCHGYRRIWS
jgi:hypothetical protein